MFIELSPRELSWSEVDPARQQFDSEAAAGVVRSLRPARRVPRRPDVPAGRRRLHDWGCEEAERWADAMTRALAEHYGSWVAGWQWAHDEGDFDGGPVGSWCCPEDSVTTPDETLDRVIAALREWREWLESLAAWFEEYPLDLAATDDQRILWDRTARTPDPARHRSHRLRQRLDGHCHQVLSWLLSRWGVPADHAAHLVEQTIGGRFHSWTGPDPGAGLGHRRTHRGHRTPRRDRKIRPARAARPPPTLARRAGIRAVARGRRQHRERSGDTGARRNG
ncbi:hypothetical protein [Streptomyces nigra]|uniref:hypothetical protein n=1 Tax=Streptomyces nigra TaxID=1827580 RepID=UPI00342BFE13